MAVWAWPAPRLVGAVVSAWCFHLTMGSFYCWSNLNPYVTSYLRSRGADVSFSLMGWETAIACTAQAMTMWLGTPLALRFLSRRWVTMCGALLVPLGNVVGYALLRAAEPSALSFLVAYAVLTGSMGLAYFPPITNLMEWMPGRKGLSSGLVVAGFGGGAFVFNFVATAYANPWDVKPVAVDASGDQYFTDERVLRRIPSMFLLLASLYIALQVVGFALMFPPPARPGGAAGAAAPGHAGELAEPGAAGGKEASPSRAGLTLREAARTRAYWLLAVAFLFNGQVVLFVGSWIKVFGEDLHIRDAALSTALSISALCNALGRVVWGALADRTSPTACIGAIFLALTAFTGTLRFATSVPLFTLWAALIYFFMGGNFAVFPTAVAVKFGAEHAGTIYGSVFLGQGISMLSGSAVKQALQSLETLQLSFIIGALCFCAFLVNLGHKCPSSMDKNAPLAAGSAPPRGSVTRLLVEDGAEDGAEDGEAAGQGS